MSVENTMNQRKTKYGDFTDHAAITDALIRVCEGIPVHVQTTPAEPEAGTIVLPITNFDKLDAVKCQAIRMICDKLARILSPDGDPEYTDSWHDIQGYAKLAEDRCRSSVDAAQTELDLGQYSVEAVMPELRDRCPHCGVGREEMHRQDCITIRSWNSASLLREPSKAPMSANSPLRYKPQGFA